MCVMSMIGDHFGQSIPQHYPWVNTNTAPPPGQPLIFQTPPAVAREEFDALKRTVEEMKALLKAAKAYDERNHEPECEVDEKMEKLRKIAALVGIDLDDVLGKHA